MASNKENHETNEKNEDSDTDRASFSSIDEDVQNHIVLSERRMLLNEIHKKRKRDMSIIPRKQTTKKALSWLRTQCSIMKVHNLKNIIKKRVLRDAVEKMGFGSLLRVENMRMPLKFLKLLVTRFDPYKCAIYDHIGMKYEIGRLEIGGYIGIPFNGTKIPEQISEDVQNQLKKEFRIGGGKGEEDKVPLTTMLKRLSEFTEPTDEFKRWFVAYMLTCFLCPTTANTLSVSNLPAISVAANAEKYNWVEYVLRWLRHFSKSFHGVKLKKRRHQMVMAAVLLR